jgi:MFS family permease
VPFLSGIGHATTLAAGALGAAIGISAVGKLAGGYLGDRVGALRALQLALVLDAAAVALLPFVASVPLLVGFVVLHGLAIGTEVAVTPVIALAVLGKDRFATLYGLLQLGSTVAVGVAPVVPGLVFDATGSYAGALLFWLATILVGVGIAFAMRLPEASAAPVPQAPGLAPGTAPSPPPLG